jgi:hypothetical protein
MPQYIVRYAAIKPDLTGCWDGPAWDQAETLELARFRSAGSDHKPKTAARLLYNSSGIFGIFRVEDRYVRSIHAEYLSPVYKDSCVEFFVKPKQDRGYFNFEFNCSGALFCSYIIDSARTAEGFRNFVKLSEEDGKQILIYNSMPDIVEPEIREPVTWLLEFFIPFCLFEQYIGSIGNVAGQSWRANFYKCGDETSHPHWASWTPLPEKNFHLPNCFGEIRFE